MKQQALIVLAWLLCSSFGIVPAGGGGGCTSEISQPSPASGASLNCLSFYDDFASTNTIDTAATGQPGFNLYPQNYFGIGNTSTGDYSVSNSTLTITNAVQTAPGGIGLQTAAPKSVSPNIPIGYQIKAPFYVEIKFATNKSLAPGSLATGPCGVGGMVGARYSWPTLWMQDVSLLFDQTNQTTTGGNRAEIDLLEFYVGCNGMTAGTWDQLANIHIWTAWNTIGPDSTHHVSWGSTWDDMTYHTLGVLVKTAVMGGGTGSATWYFDGSQVQQITWASGGSLSPVETSAFDLIMNPGHSTWPIHVDYVQVWQ